MLCFDFIEEILGTQGIKLKETEYKGKSFLIYVEMPRREHKCPVCKESTDWIHDYRIQKIKAGEANGYLLNIYYRKRRYKCQGCGKQFYEENNFVGRYKRMTKMMTLTILELIQGTKSFTEVAKTLGISTQTVIRTFDTASYARPDELPKVLGIDEFRGNAGGEKFQVSLTDPENKKVLDILPCRKESELSLYFKGFPKAERDKVQYFVSDMYKPYLRIQESWFPNAVHIVDKYHWVRQLFWAFESIRKREQQKHGKNHRLYFKRNRNILTRRFRELNDDDQQQVLNILYLSSDLSTAHFYKERMQQILDMDDPKEQKKQFVKLTDGMKQSGIHELERCADTYYRWLKGILASFDYKYTNAFTEGMNNKIKVLKRNAYGYRDFSRNRKRILRMA